MANAKILEQKAQVVSEIKDKFAKAKSVVIFDYRGLLVSEVNELRRNLRANDSDYKVYKNTLIKRALNDSEYNLDEFLEGPSAISFSDDELAPVRILSEFAKKHNALEGKIAKKEQLEAYAAIPSRDALLTMLAGQMIGTVRDLSICLDLYAKEKEEK